MGGLGSATVDATAPHLGGFQMARLAVLLCCLLLIGCENTERLNRLEKQNADLKAELDRDRSTRDLDLQAKCSRDARQWFNGNWARDKDTILLDYTNHYNVKQNKCFILVESHYNSHLAGLGGQSWTNDMSLFDVYENAKYGQFDENHYTYFRPQISTKDEVILCNVQGNECKTGDEFNTLVRPYMND